MRSKQRRAVIWVVLVGWLAGVNPSGLDATEQARAERSGRGEAVVTEPGSAKSRGEDARLEKWSRVARRPRKESTDPVRLSAYGWIRIFQRFISPVDGPSCSFHPNCSTYGIQAIEEHGLLLGLPMTAERVMRNHRPENPARYPLIEKGGDFYYWDPVKTKGKGQR
jgi:putative membrane protein insertion efficiency factor